MNIDINSLFENKSISAKGAFNRELSDEMTEFLSIYLKNSIGLEISKYDINKVINLINNIEINIDGRIAGNIENYIINYFVCHAASKLAHKNKNPAFLEIGVLFGGSLILSQIAKDRKNEITSIGIDPFDGYYYSDTGSKNDIVLDIPIDIETAKQNIKKILGNMTGIELLPYYSYDQKSVDFIGDYSLLALFIDGDHTYHGIQTDWSMYSERVVDNGFVIIDNYHDKDWPEVTTFVDNVILIDSRFSPVIVYDHVMILKKISDYKIPYNYLSKIIMFRELELAREYKRSLKLQKENKELIYKDEQLNRQLHSTNQKLKEKEQIIYELRNSRSYRFGFYVLHPTKIPSKIIEKILNKFINKKNKLENPKENLQKNINHIDEVNVIAEHLSKKDIKKGFMLDVGAHRGAAMGPFAVNDWNVICFEPDRKNRKYLLKSASRFNDKVKVENFAVSNKDNEVLPFYTSEESTGISSLNDFHSSHRESYQVKTVTLKTYLQKNNITKVDFLKIDTEGFDLFVLKGFPFEKIKPSYILCEFENYKTKRLGYTTVDLIKFLHDHGYSIIISEWEPVVRYGIKHKWKYFIDSEKAPDNDRAWGNIIAVLNKNDYKELSDDLRKIYKFKKDV
ncbi:MAG: FkbM family methyltransferase [Spirochaetia bacterium]|nr:FkbM family methyltransferase [Spirochaetia bacterium]